MKEVYAEGIVRVRQKDEVDSRERVLRLRPRARALVDPGRALPDHDPNGQKATLHIKADELRMLSEVQFELNGARFSLCPFGNPHYHVASDTAKLFRARASGNRRPERKPAGEPIPIYYYSASGNTLLPGSGFPVLWLPDFSGDWIAGGHTLGYVKDVGFGGSTSSKRTIGILLGDELRRRNGKKWGTLCRRPRLPEQRRPGRRSRFDYEQQVFKGRLKAAYQHDVGEDKIYGSRPTEERWRLSWRNVPDFGTTSSSISRRRLQRRGLYPTASKASSRTKAAGDVRVPEARRSDVAVTGLFRPGERLGDGDRVPPEARLRARHRSDHRRLNNPLYLTARTESRGPGSVDDALDLPAGRHRARGPRHAGRVPFLAGPGEAHAVRRPPDDVLRIRPGARPRSASHGFTFGGEVSPALARLRLPRRALPSRRPAHVSCLDRVPADDRRQPAPEELFQYDPVDADDNLERRSPSRSATSSRPCGRKESRSASTRSSISNLAMIWYPHPSVRTEATPGATFRRPRPPNRRPAPVRGAFEWNPNDQDSRAGFRRRICPEREARDHAGIHHFDHAYDVVYGQASWRTTEKWLLRAYASTTSSGTMGPAKLGGQPDGHDWVFSAVLHADFNPDEFRSPSVWSPAFFDGSSSRAAWPRASSSTSGRGHPVDSWVRQSESHRIKRTAGSSSSARPSVAE